MRIGFSTYNYQNNFKILVGEKERQQKNNGHLISSGNLTPLQPNFLGVPINQIFPHQKSDKLICIYCNIPLLNIPLFNKNFFSNKRSNKVFHPTQVFKTSNDFSGSMLYLSKLKPFIKHMHKPQKIVFDKLLNLASFYPDKNLFELLLLLRGPSLEALQKKELTILTELQNLSSSFDTNTQIRINQIINAAKLKISNNLPDDSFKRQAFINELSSVTKNAKNPQSTKEFLLQLTKLPKSINDPDAFIVKYSDKIKSSNFKAIESTLLPLLNKDEKVLYNELINQKNNKLINEIFNDKMFTKNSISKSISSELLTSVEQDYDAFFVSIRENLNVFSKNVIDYISSKSPSSNELSAFSKNNYLELFNNREVFEKGFFAEFINKLPKSNYNKDAFVVKYFNNLDELPDVSLNNSFLKKITPQEKNIAVRFFKENNITSHQKLKEYLKNNYIQHQNKLANQQLVLFNKLVESLKKHFINKEKEIQTLLNDIKPFISDISKADPDSLKKIIPIHNQITSFNPKFSFVNSNEFIKLVSNFIDPNASLSSPANVFSGLLRKIQSFRFSFPDPERIALSLIQGGSLTKEHIFAQHPPIDSKMKAPQSLINSADDWVFACASCNNSRENMDLEDFIKFAEIRPAAIKNYIINMLQLSDQQNLPIVKQHVLAIINTLYEASNKTLDLIDWTKAVINNYKTPSSSL